MAPGQAANGDDLGTFVFDFLYTNGILSVLIRIASIK